MGAGADRAARPVEPADRAAPTAARSTIEIVAGRDASVNFDMQSLTSLQPRRPHPRAPLAAPRALPASARLELLRDAAAQAALGRRHGWRRLGCLRRPEVLRRLSLRNFVIVPALEIEFRPRLFTVLTGETGAGKSILVDALQLALGSRGDVGVVREGAARAEIERRVRRRRRPRRPWLADAGFERRAGRRRPPAAAPNDRRAGQEPRLDQRQRRDDRAAARGGRPPGRHPRPARLAEPDARRPRCARCSTRTPASTRAPLAAAWSALEGGASARARTARTRQADLERERERLAWQIGEVDEARAGRRTNGTSSTPSTPASRTPRR